MKSPVLTPEGDCRGRRSLAKLNQLHKRGVTTSKRAFTFLCSFAAVCAIAVAIHSLPISTVAAQTAVMPYNPYPPGILPANIDTEIARVQMEIQGIEASAIAQWQALRSPTVTGQPPTLQGTGVQAIQILGEIMNYDLNMSPNQTRACASCHMPYAGFSGPIPSVNLTMVAYPGAAIYRAAKRTAQRYTYAPYFPALTYNQEQAGL